MTHTMPVGVVGLGLMGCSIVTCLLAAGHPVVAVAPIPADVPTAEPRISHHLADLEAHGILDGTPTSVLSRLIVTEAYADLQQCQLVIECTLEDADIKRRVYEQIEAVVGDETVIASNTSAIPISQLQQLTRRPQRFIGLHWAEPSHTTRFLEVICGDQTDVAYAEFFYALSQHWGKEPTLVRKDIRGFIANRLMYAMYREAFDLVEKGYATVEDVDRACRNNTGYWMTLAGVFRWMDLTGVPAYLNVLKDLFPTLSNRTDVPPLIQDIVDRGGRGVANGIGFYDYAPGEAEAWRQTFERFSFEIRELALRYPADVVKSQLDTDI
ncbi:3-hydroxyacyl-CoA dehydrogenase family protein [Spirosoma utsteinense]|uniref:3-hydroxybutyryl-CoA dehydrogenase n=1 Tax=Spirosoma utsteinense TaxID=2585773 RepID=A0ABR6WD22_9BACT|nr:3-hydroxyacyl-CoA dehydrogenase family protein [Spirosoma utsteinense]MBC3788233.1 3-hydroxybutyryl-CoA dehydrogenase [Spirosoma utsteinense]MBC3794194.1 3-hydroxybutyryl-CoA dehydrogenase [Spirosoma utsteinense]